jgi:hypothetical protein
MKPKTHLTKGVKRDDDAGYVQSGVAKLRENEWVRVAADANRTSRGKGRRGHAWCKDVPHSRQG